MSIKDGGPAYPCPSMAGLPNGEFLHPEGGMSLRDHFAGLAMQGALMTSMSLGEIDEADRAQCLDRAAGLFYQMADAMLRAREAGQ